MQLVFFLCLLMHNIYAQSPSAQEQQVFNVEALKPYEGAVIHEIHVHGLKWTKEKAVRWLLSEHEGDTFDAEKWLVGIHKLYDTTVLYNVITSIKRIDDHQIDIDVAIADRWTLMPFAIAQAGGGSNNVGGGIFEANFLGYFAQVSASYSTFDNVATYDFNIYQEFFLDTNYIWGIDISETGTPVSLQDNSGDSLGDFTWSRQQYQLLLGDKMQIKGEKIRLFSYFEYYRDRMVDNSQAPEVYVYSGPQYRIRPVLIMGRSELTNFLEQGHEWTIAPTTANFFGYPKSYSTFVTTYKKVFLDANTNYAFFINTGAMTSAPIPYLFRLGGYDTVRGFSTNRAIGRYYINDNLEYRPYLTRFPLPLIGEVVMQGNIFTDSAIMWNSSDLAQTRGVNSELTLLSVGTGVRFNFMRFAGAILRIDFARTVTPDEGWGASLGVGQFF